MRDLLQGVQNMVENMVQSGELIPLDSLEGEQLTEELQEQEDWTQEDEDRFNGEEAGTVFAQRHVIDKLNLFIEEYRRNKYSEAFIDAFIEGVNGVTGGNITMRESQTEQVDNEQ